MPVHKRKYGSGKVVWFFQFDAPGSTKLNRREVKESGFKTKQEAIDAEATRRVEEQKKYEIAKAGPVTAISAALPKTLSDLLKEFLVYADDKLAPKTAERYREMADYLAPELCAMPLGEIKPIHLSREWDRLLKSGGHTRKGVPRPLAAKTVRSMAGVLSSAFGRAIRWELVDRNPVSDSEPPVPKKRKGIALAPARQAEAIENASGPWCMGTFIEVAAATGARRGEVLALRWQDIENGRMTIARSLTQTKTLLAFKETKTENIRVLTLPESTRASLELHRTRQQEFVRQFGPDYRSDLDLIFANPNGTPLKPNSISATISALCRRLKLPNGVSLHTLRHTHGSHLLAAGVPLPAVSERLGHSSVRVTADVYSHAIEGQDGEAARRWDAFQKAASAHPQSGVAPGSHHVDYDCREDGVSKTSPTENKPLEPK
ncbi:MAG TPA: tyrosine-type recombinase/integrase [Bryobacteraceae bacterium]|nr:tyrosine-type recombinase/integrase [Bryobacteraceae bacterium]